MGYHRNPLFDLDSNGVGVSSTTLRARTATGSIHASKSGSGAIQRRELDDSSFTSYDRLTIPPSAHPRILFYIWYWVLVS